MQAGVCRRSWFEDWRTSVEPFVWFSIELGILECIFRLGRGSLVLASQKLERPGCFDEFDWHGQGWSPSKSLVNTIDN